LLEASCCLELQAQGHLQDTGLRNRAGALPELRTVDVLIAHKKDGMIQNVEGFRSESQLESLSNGEVFSG
jgi:hypothetical protein